MQCYIYLVLIWLVAYLYSFQDALYMQITRWFQNSTYTVKKACGLVSQRKSAKKADTSTVITIEEDNESVKRHLSDLSTEWKKKTGRSQDRIARLLSLTINYRRADKLSKNASSRIVAMIHDFPMLRKPLYVSYKIADNIYYWLCCSLCKNFT